MKEIVIGQRWKKNFSHFLYEISLEIKHEFITKIEYWENKLFNPLIFTHFPHWDAMWHKVQFNVLTRAELVHPGQNQILPSTRNYVLTRTTNPHSLVKWGGYSRTSMFLGMGCFSVFLTQLHFCPRTETQLRDNNPSRHGPRKDINFVHYISPLYCPMV